MLELLLHSLSTFVALFVIIDPFAVVPVYLTLTQRFSADDTRATRRKAAGIALVILLLFALTGLSVFKVFGITLPAFQVAGGILLMLLGIAQLNASRERLRSEETEESLEHEDVSVFPLATPLLAGPGAISTVVLYASRARNAPETISLLVAVVLAIVASYACLAVAPKLYRVLGQTGLNLLTRLMGIILTAVGVQFILNGVRGALELMGFTFP